MGAQDSGVVVTARDPSTQWGSRDMGARDLSPGIAPDHLLRWGAYCPGTYTHFNNFLIKNEKKKNASSLLGWVGGVLRTRLETAE